MHPLQSRTGNRKFLSGLVWWGAVAGFVALGSGDWKALGQVGAKPKTKTAVQAAGVNETPPEPASVETAIRVFDLRTFPTMKGAVIAGARRVGQLNYQAKGSAKTAFEFQQKHLLEQGWKELPGSQVDVAYASAKFTKAGFLAYVFTSDVAGDQDKVGWAQVMVVNYGNVLTGKLPVPPGVKPFYPDVASAAYLTEAKVAETLEACRKLLAAEKWAPYGSAGSGTDSPMLFFKRNAIKLQLWVSTAPAEGGKTMIRYSTELLSADLPVPPDAPDPRYDDGQKVASFDWPGENAEPVLAFYQKTLPPQGWTPTTKQPVADAKKKTQFQIFRNPQGDIISVDTEQYTGITRVKVQHQSAAELAEIDRRLAEQKERLEKEKLAAGKKKSEEETAPKAAPQSRKKKSLRDIPGIGKLPDGVELPDVPDVAEMLEELEQVEGQPAAGKQKPAKKKSTDPNNPIANKTGPAASGPAKIAEIPVPKDVADQEQAGVTLWVDDKSYLLPYAVAYETKADDNRTTGVLCSEEPIAVDKLVAALNDGKGDGGVLDFKRCLKLRFDAAGKLEYLFFYADGLSINSGDPNQEVVKAEVTVKEGRARGKAVMEKPEPFFKKSYRFDATFDAKLVTGSATGSTTNSEPGTEPGNKPGAGDLAADESDGLPFPKENAERVSTSTLYRKSVNVVTPAAMQPLVDFYRRELAARGWKENVDVASVTADKALLSFAGPEGEASVRMSQKGKDVAIIVSARSPEKAKAAGLLPQPNRGRIVLANAQNQEAVLTINGKPYTLAAGRGAKDPKDGTTLHVQPGRYNLVINVPGEADKTEALNVRVDETWGVILLPTGGLLADQLY